MTNRYEMRIRGFGDDWLDYFSYLADAMRAAQEWEAQGYRVTLRDFETNRIIYRT